MEATVSRGRPVRAVSPAVLHLAHHFEPGSTVLKGISEGWPVILASLKTLLETGEALPSPQPA